MWNNRIIQTVLMQIHMYKHSTNLLQEYQVNHLLIIFIDDSPPEKATEPPSPLVPFLQKFAEPRNKKPSVSIFSNNLLLLI